MPEAQNPGIITTVKEKLYKYGFWVAVGVILLLLFGKDKIVIDSNLVWSVAALVVVYMLLPFLVKKKDIYAMAHEIRNKASVEEGIILDITTENMSVSEVLDGVFCFNFKNLGRLYTYNTKLGMISEAEPLTIYSKKQDLETSSIMKSYLTNEKAAEIARQRLSGLGLTTEGE